VEIDHGTLRTFDQDLEPSDWLAATSEHMVVATGSPAQATEVVKITLATGDVTTLRVSSAGVLGAGDISEPHFIEFPTSGDRTAFALYYPPRNGAFQGAPGQKPPLLVISHGGPTSAAERRLALSKQFWTTRGFAIVDVDYGGSTGYGRAYRQRLNGQWGVVDVEDCIHAARFLVSRGLADERRLIIRGASAGGYTTLAALTFHPGVFAAGASYFGVSDAEALAADTHKFEARYCNSLIGPYPEARDLYRERSPIHFVDRMSCPVIFLQGLEDKVVPPSQSERMADAVRAKGLPVEYVAFPGEQHGFRAEASIVRALEAELAFYGRVFGFTPAPGRIPA
jgi:dipeptidyl aminopeptidase/acylaminoacyl peptidase